MSEQEIYERLNEVFRNVFDDDDIEVEAGTTADDNVTALSISISSSL